MRLMTNFFLSFRFRTRELWQRIFRPVVVGKGCVYHNEFTLAIQRNDCPQCSLTDFQVWSVVNHFDFLIIFIVFIGLSFIRVRTYNDIFAVLAGFCLRTRLRN